MSAVELIEALRRRGVFLRPTPEGKIRFKPVELMTPELRAELLARKPEVLRLLAAEVATAAPCYSCGTRRRWRLPGWEWKCPRCHPPHPELSPVEWTGPEDEPGWTMGPILRCIRCGRGTACRDPQGRPRHPGCGGR